MIYHRFVRVPSARSEEQGTKLRRGGIGLERSGRIELDYTPSVDGPEWIILLRNTPYSDLGVETPLPKAVRANFLVIQRLYSIMR
jgi:hypothetical protein